MQTDSEIIEILQNRTEEFLTNLRMRDGMDESSFEKLKFAIILATNHWEKRNDVPKDLAAILVDLFASTKDNEVWYQKEPKVMERIAQAAGELQGLVYKLFS